MQLDVHKLIPLYIFLVSDLFRRKHAEKFNTDNTGEVTDHEL